MPGKASGVNHHGQRTRFCRSLLSEWLSQHLASRIGIRANHLLDRGGRSSPWGGQAAGCDAEQAADERAFYVDLAAGFTQVRAAKFGKRCRVLRVVFDRELGHFFTRCGHPPAAVMVSGDAFECRDALPNKRSVWLLAYFGFVLIDRGRAGRGRWRRPAFDCSNQRSPTQMCSALKL